MDQGGKNGVTLNAPKGMATLRSRGPFIFAVRTNG